MDDFKRPLFAFGARIHENCERRGHFDVGEFVKEWGDEGHKNGWCLYQMGCKGPVTFHNCPAVRYNDGAGIAHLYVDKGGLLDGCWGN